MARDDDQTLDKDFLDIDLDEPLEPLEESDAPVAPSRAEPSVSKGDGVLYFDNKRYAVGLSWLIAEEEGDTDLATQRAKDFKADFYCMRQGVVTQQGFGFLKKGHRVGLPALASVAADALVGEWHGVFTADNGWWYLAVHADNIAPDGDLLFTSEEAAYNHFIAQSEQYHWPRAYAPESWNIPESSGEVPLSKVINEGTAPALKPVTMDAIFSGKRNKNLAVIAVLAIIGLIAVSLLGQQLLPALVPQQAQVPVPNVEVSDTLQAPPKEPELVQESAEGSLTQMSLILPSALMSACIEGFSQITMALPGWKLTTLRCKSTFVEGSWARTSGSYEMVEPYLARFPQDVTKNFNDGNTLLASRRLIGLTDIPPARDFYERNYAIMTVSRRLADLGSLQIKEVIPAAGQQLLQNIDMIQQAGFTNIGQNKIEVRPLTRDDLPYLSIQLRTKTPPNLIGKYFDWPGVIVLSVENDVPAGGWLYDLKMITRPDARLVEANTKAKKFAEQGK